jgi:hypothetical protein
MLYLVVSLNLISLTLTILISYNLIKISAPKKQRNIYHFLNVTTGILAYFTFYYFNQHFGSGDFTTELQAFIIVGLLIGVVITCFNSSFCPSCRKLAYSKTLWSKPKKCNHCGKKIPNKLG